MSDFSKLESACPFANLNYKHTINRILKITDTIALYDPAKISTTYIRVGNDEDKDHLMDHISKLDDWQIFEPRWLDQPVSGNSKLDRIINWHVENGETLVVRDNNDNSLSFHSFPHERGYFWSPKDVKELINSIGWYDLETLRHGETASECVSRMPPRFRSDHR